MGLEPTTSVCSPSNCRRTTRYHCATRPWDLLRALIVHIENNKEVVRQGQEGVFMLGMGEVMGGSVKWLKLGLGVWAFE